MDPGAKACAPSFAKTWTVAQAQAWLSKARAFDSSIAGPCESACYLRQVHSCEGGSLAQPASKRGAWCVSKPYCRWQEKLAACTPALFGSDAWGKEAARAFESCAAVGSDESACGRTPVALRLLTERADFLLNYPPAVEASQAYQCTM